MQRSRACILVLQRLFHNCWRVCKAKGKCSGQHKDTGREFMQGSRACVLVLQRPFITAGEFARSRQNAHRYSTFSCSTLTRYSGSTFACIAIKHKNLPCKYITAPLEATLQFPCFPVLSDRLRSNNSFKIPHKGNSQAPLKCASMSTQALSQAHPTHLGWDARSRCTMLRTKAALLCNKCNTLSCLMNPYQLWCAWRALYIIQQLNLHWTRIRVSTTLLLYDHLNNKFIVM